MAVEVQGSALAARGLRNTFWNTYHQRFASMSAKLSLYCQTVPSTLPSEIYGWAESSPTMQRWDEGNAIPTNAFLSHSFQVKNYKFGLGIPMSAVTIADDQMGIVYPRAQEAAVSGALLDYRIFMQLLTGGNVPDAAQLLPVVPNAADGVAFFSAFNAAGGPRFGRVGGNLNSPGAGPGSPASVQVDIFTNLSIFQQFQHTNGQPLYPEADAIRALGYVFNPNFLYAWEGATQQMFNAVTAGGGAAAVSNIVRDVGGKLRIDLWPDQKITNAFSYCCALDYEDKTLFLQEREPLTEQLAEPGNSDTAREYDIWKLYFRRRLGGGLGVPLNWQRNG
jgi:hypothetical protein